MPLPEAGVRKHLAPEGALRQSEIIFSMAAIASQKAPRTRRCIKTLVVERSVEVQSCQKAPRTRRCIKTAPQPPPAPRSPHVRKHLAPEGALRLFPTEIAPAQLSSQKAPRTRRCIKTRPVRPDPQPPPRQKAPRTRRCIKT